MYDLGERGIDDEELLEESSSTVSKSSVKESNEESTGDFITESNIITQVKNLYKKNKTLQRIMHVKMGGERKISQNLIKEELRIELEDYQVKNRMLYVRKKLYVFNVATLKIRIVKFIYDSLLDDHKERVSTYDRVSAHYYWLDMTSIIFKFV